MRFTKYEKRKAYHWREYVRGGKYRQHCDFIRGWVLEKKILDIGAGDGLITYLLDATGIDNEPEAIRIADAIGANVALGDAYNLPFPDNSFEAVTMIDVIEHLGDPEKVLIETRRVAPVLYIATPERQDDRRVRDRFHVQEWKRDELVDLLKKNNYQLTEEILYVKQGDTLYARFERTHTGA